MHRPAVRPSCSASSGPASTISPRAPVSGEPAEAPKATGKCRAASAGGAGPGRGPRLGGARPWHPELDRIPRPEAGAPRPGRRHGGLPGGLLPDKLRESQPRAPRPAPPHFSDRFSPNLSFSASAGLALGLLRLGARPVATRWVSSPGVSLRSPCAGRGWSGVLPSRGDAGLGWGEHYKPHLRAPNLVVGVVLGARLSPTRPLFVWPAGPWCCAPLCPSVLLAVGLSARVRLARFACSSSSLCPSLASACVTV